MTQKFDIVGKQYGRLTVIKYNGAIRGKGGKTSGSWLCVCACGNTKVVSTGSLQSGNVKSCGCLKKDLIIAKKSTHGLSNTRIYRIFQLMKYRCLHPSCKAYKYYGERGIKICDEWINDFTAFYKWAMANGYKDNLTIDRIDTNGDYEPANCRWIPMSEQNNNKRNCHYITYMGEKETLSYWSKKLHIDRGTIKKYEKITGDGQLAIKEILAKKHKKMEV